MDKRHKGPGPGLVRVVMCPVCGQKFKAAVTTRWYWAEVRRNFGYPYLLCVPCGKAYDLLEKHGGEFWDYRNLEQVAY